ncbi:MAG: WecB/TagA/CpsF family glycosyltransferase, partial [Planctomycetota bacterium]
INPLGTPATNTASPVPLIGVKPTGEPKTTERVPKPPLPALETRWIWNIPFACVTKAQAVDRIEQLVLRDEPSYVITANLNYAMLHHHHADLGPITRSADFIVADGQPIVWRSRLGHRRLPERVAGSELIHDLAALAARHRWGIYFLGGAPGVAQACANKLVEDHPGMTVSGVESPPFRQLTGAEKAQQADRIRTSGAKILLVAFGQPKGERWIYENHQSLGVPVSLQLGASFDFIAGNAKRAPKIWQRFGCEWIYRMLGDPRRLVPRYGANLRFLAEALIRDWKHRVERWGMSLETTEPSRRSSDG